MDAAERLASRYEYGFSQDVIDRVDNVDQRMRFAPDYPTFLKGVGIDVSEFSGVPEYVDVKPKDYDEKRALAVHLPLANHLSPHNLVMVGSIAALYPERRVTAYSNQAYMGYEHGKVDRAERKKIATGDFSPLLTKLDRRLESEGVERVDHVGGSMGANLAIAGGQSEAYATDHVVAVEAVNDEEHNLFMLGAKFLLSSGGPMKDYMAANNLPMYEQALDETGGDLAFLVGVYKPTNVASARGMTRGDLRDQTIAALSTDRTHATLAYAIESEVHDASATAQIAADLQADDKFGQRRVLGIPLQGEKHACINDLGYFGAIVATGLDQHVA